MHTHRRCRAVTQSSSPQNSSGWFPSMISGIASWFGVKSAEFGTLKRVYCSTLTCSRFLGPQTSGRYCRIMACPETGRRAFTFSSCKSRILPGVNHICKVDARDQNVLDLGRNAGWAQCPGCAQMIELSMGCYHMTCRCQTQFCYLCRAPWKTCACTEWDEFRLRQAAEARVDALLGHVAAPAVANTVHPGPINTRTEPVVEPRTREGQGASLSRGIDRAGDDDIPDRVSIRSPPPPYHEVVSATYHLQSKTHPTPREDKSSRKNQRHGVRTLGQARVQSERASSSRDTARPSTVTSSQSPPNAAPAIARPILGEGSTPSRPPDFWGTVPNEMKKLAKQKKTHVCIPATPSSDSSAIERAELIKQAIEDLLHHHDCAHDTWDYRRGAGRCENCHHHLPRYLYVSGSWFNHFATC